MFEAEIFIWWYGIKRNENLKREIKLQLISLRPPCCLLVMVLGFIDRSTIAMHDPHPPSPKAEKTVLFKTSFFHLLIAWGTKHVFNDCEMTS